MIYDKRRKKGIGKGITQILDFETIDKNKTLILWIGVGIDEFSKVDWGWTQRFYNKKIKKMD